MTTRSTPPQRTPAGQGCHKSGEGQTGHGNHSTERQTLAGADPPARASYLQPHVYSQTRCLSLGSGDRGTAGTGSAPLSTTMRHAGPSLAELVIRYRDGVSCQKKGRAVEWIRLCAFLRLPAPSLVPEAGHSRLKGAFRGIQGRAPAFGAIRDGAPRTLDPSQHVRGGDARMGSPQNR